MVELKILKLNLFQETACYKKPFAFKVAETYPLPPYSTVIGMVHKILQAKSGEYFPLDISIQGEYESIFSNYQNLRMFKGKDQVTNMPRNVHQLLNINLIVHIKAEDAIIDKLYENIITGAESFTLGRNEDLVRVDEIKIVEQTKRNSAFLKHNAYIPLTTCQENEIEGINYRLNTVYTIDENQLRKWEKVNVKYVEKANEVIQEGLEDEDGDFMFFYQ